MKKTLSILMTLALLCTLSVPVLAAAEAPSPQNPKSIKVTMKVDSGKSYSYTIPNVISVETVKLPEIKALSNGSKYTDGLDLVAGKEVKMYTVPIKTEISIKGFGMIINPVSSGSVYGGIGGVALEENDNGQLVASRLSRKEQYFGSDLYKVPNNDGICAEGSFQKFSHEGYFLFNPRPLEEPYYNHSSKSYRPENQFRDAVIIRVYDKNMSNAVTVTEATTDKGVTHTETYKDGSKYSYLIPGVTKTEKVKLPTASSIINGSNSSELALVGGKELNMFTVLVGTKISRKGFSSSSLLMMEVINGKLYGSKVSLEDQYKRYKFGLGDGTSKKKIFPNGNEVLIYGGNTDIEFLKSGYYLLSLKPFVEPHYNLKTGEQNHDYQFIGAILLRVV